jgi:hypothetical protein
MVSFSRAAVWKSLPVERKGPLRSVSAMDVAASAAFGRSMAAPVLMSR